MIIALKGRILRVLTGAFCGFLFGVCFLSGLAFLTGYQVYYETSDSMNPVIRKGSLLLVKKEKNYSPGDIIAFYAVCEGEKICVTHRIVRQISEDTYITKGDANTEEDRGVVRKEEILGKVTGYIPYYGYVCFWMKENILFLLLLLAAAILRGHAILYSQKYMSRS